MSQPRDLASNRAAGFADFLTKSQCLQGRQLAEAIPRACFEPRLGRGMLGFGISYGIYATSVVGLAFSPHWTLSLALWVLAGLGGWGLHCIAHECGHNSFSRNKVLNVVVGHLALLPLAYPFYAWKYVHSLHHMHTNHLDLDTDWRPLPRAVYERMPAGRRLIYRATRTVMFWAGTINYWMVSAFRPGFFPKRDMRSHVRWSIAFVGLAVGAYLCALFHGFGLRGVLLYFVAPWIAIHAWFSTTTLMHHTAPEIPFLNAKEWTTNGSRMLVTTDYRYPKWLLFLTHNISIHTAHHVAPVVPFYHLPKAQAALKQAYPGMIRERPFSLASLWSILRHCHFYDPAGGYYEASIRPSAASPHLSRAE